MDVASRDYGIDGRPTNTTRIAILTGLDRKTIKLVKERTSNEGGVGPSGATDRITRILSGWHTDPDFIDEAGKPKVMSFADDVPNLTTLLYRYGGDVQPTAMLKELRRIDVVEEVRTGTWRVMARNYIAMTANPETLSRAFSNLGDVASNMYHNLYEANDQVPKKFERRVSSPNVPRHQVAAFRHFLDQQGQIFLEILDTWLTEHECDPDKPTFTDDQLVRLGLGMYWIERNKTQKQ